MKKSETSANSPVTIALFAINYAPEPTGIGPYVTELAEHLASEGHSVEVVTAFPHYPWWNVRDGFKRKRATTEILNGVRLNRRWCWVPSRPTLVKRFFFEISFLLSALPVAMKTKADIYVGYSPAMSSAILARIAAKRHGGRFVMVLQDLAGRGIRQSGLTSLRMLSDGLAHVEMATARSARPAIAITEGFAGPLKEGGVKAENIVVLPNWAKADMPTPSDVDIKEMRFRFAPNGEILAVHTGSMGVKQALWQVIEAAKLAEGNGDNIKFVLVGDGGERKRLEELATGLTNLTFVDPLPEAEFSAILHAADVLLLCQDPSNSDMSFPSKLTSYVRAERPIVGMVPAMGSVGLYLAASETKWSLCLEPSDIGRQVSVLARSHEMERLSPNLERQPTSVAVSSWAARILADGNGPRTEDAMPELVVPRKRFG